MLHNLAVPLKPEDRPAFAEFYHRYKRLVLYTISKMMPGSPHVEDVAQEVFLYICGNFDRLPVDDSNKIVPYLTMCAKSRALNMLMQRDRECLMDHTGLASLEDSADMPEDQLVSLDKVRYILQEVAQLSEIYRIPLELKIWGLTDLEGAELMGIPAATFRKRLQRARTLLLKRLEEEDGK